MGWSPSIYFFKKLEFLSKACREDGVQFLVNGEPKRESLEAGMLILIQRLPQRPKTLISVMHHAAHHTANQVTFKVQSL